jgi:YCII-related domain
MQPITDEFMLQMRAKARAYCIVMLKVGPQYTQPGAEQIIWEHGRRNYALRAEGLLAMVGPVTDTSDIRGFGIFTVSVDEARTIMDEDPGVKAGVFVYELHPWRSFPGDSLPA